MSLSVKEALDLQAFKDAKVVAGISSLNNKIQFVDVIEVPDIDNWLRKNTLALTTAFAVKNKESGLEDLVTLLADKGVSALAIKPGRFINNIPDNVLQIAEYRKLPLIELPLNAAYSDIIKETLGVILDKQNTLLKLGDELHQRLNNMVLDGGGLDAVTQILSQVIGHAVFIENLNGDLIACSASEQEIMHHKKLFSRRLKKAQKLTFQSENIAVVKDEVNHQLIAPIFVDKQLYCLLSILFNEEQIDEFTIMALQRGAIVSGLEIMKKKAIVETEIRLQRDFVEDLLDGKHEEEYTLVKRAREFGWDITQENMIMIVSIENFRDKISMVESEYEVQDIKKKIYNSIRHVLQHHAMQPILIQRKDRYIVFLCTSNCNSMMEKKDTAYKVALEIQKAIASKFSYLDVVIGIGRPIKQVNKFKNSYDEAQKALQIGPILNNPSNTYYFDDLGIYRLLDSCSDVNAIKDFYTKYLGALVQYDENNTTQLLETLETYYSCNSNAVVAAEKLFLHRNTLNYRIKRIKQILELNIDDPEIKLCVYLALKIKHLYNYS